MRWWFRFQLSLQAFSAVNFLLLSVSASPVIARFFNAPAKLVFVLLPFPVFGALLLVGYLMDKTGYVRHQEKEVLGRSMLWQELFARLDRLEKKNA